MKQLFNGSRISFEEDSRIYVQGDYTPWYNEDEDILEGQDLPLVFCNLDMLDIDQDGIWLEQMGKETLLEDNTWYLYETDCTGVKENYLDAETLKKELDVEITRIDIMDSTNYFEKDSCGNWNYYVPNSCESFDASEISDVLDDVLDDVEEYGNGSRIWSFDEPQTREKEAFDKYIEMIKKEKNNELHIVKQNFLKCINQKLEKEFEGEELEEIKTYLNFIVRMSYKVDELVDIDLILIKKIECDESNFEKRFLSEKRYTASCKNEKRFVSIYHVGYTFTINYYFIKESKKITNEKVLYLIHTNQILEKDCPMPIYEVLTQAEFDKLPSSCFDEYWVKTSFTEITSIEDFENHPNNFCQAQDDMIEKIYNYFGGKK